MGQGQIYISDADERIRQLLGKILTARGFEVASFAEDEELLAAVQGHRDSPPDLVLADARVPGLGGLEVLHALRRLSPDLPIILMSAFATVRAGVEAIKRGATDFLVKPIGEDELVGVVETVLEQRRLANENRALKAEIRKRFDPDQIVYESAVFGSVIEMARKVAPSEASVLIQGESGTGKELVASTLHYYSRRAEERFLTINCAALTDTLLESQLFGHMKGAFTGAIANQRGLVEEADKGTLFLDEIGDISPGLQAKLLRVLQEKEFMPIGATKVRHADVRFIAATNKDLEQEVAAGRFREDLFYRLNVVTLHTPPLRKRPQDIEPLAKFFVRRYAVRGDKWLQPAALEKMQRYAWPGNVRELENVIEMAVILSADGPIELEHLPLKLSAPPALQDASEALELPSEELPLEEVERRYIEQVYRAQGYHKLRTSEILGISRRTLDRKLKDFDIQRDT